MKISKKYCVYAHSCDGDIVYVGSGTPARAFSIDEKSRTKRWRDAVDGRPVTVTIFSQHDERADAYECEADHILGLQPAGNTHGKSQRLSRNGLPLGRPRKHGKRKTGAFIYCPTYDVRCPTLRFAARLVDAPLSSVSRALYDGVAITNRRGEEIRIVLAWD